MPGEDKRYTPDFKKEVAQKALDQSKKDLEGLSKKYDVPVSVILMWATELEKGGPQVFETADETEDDGFIEEPADIDLDISDDEVAEAVQYGVMFDKLNYKRLVFWSLFGIILLIIFVQALFEMNQYNVRQEQIAQGSQSFESLELKKEAREQLNSFGVVNLEEGIYRIPIDSAISDITADED